MRRDQQIRVNELLLEREELFVRVHDLERAITDILGGPYPFEKPKLPSDLKIKRKAGAVRIVAARKAGVRRLEQGEALYRVSYSQAGQTAQETHVRMDALETLLASQSAKLKVLKIETLGIDGAPVETLFESE